MPGTCRASPRFDSVILISFERSGSNVTITSRTGVRFGRSSAIHSGPCIGADTQAFMSAFTLRETPR